jgi:hypothetical protein
MFARTSTYASPIWRSVDAVYELARTRILIARACRRLGDEDGADLELAVARRTLAEIGAGFEAQGKRDGVVRTSG